MISHFFIDRPIFASVLSIVITLTGAIALFWLPLAQYPPITPPSIQVIISYPGANAQVVADTVAAPIEQQVNGVPGMLYMSSQSSNDGTYTLTVTFDLGTNLNTALVMVQNRVQLALPQLPPSVQRQGITIRKKTPDILLVVNLFSPDGRYDDIYLSNYATIYLQDELYRVDGVTQINYLGQRAYSIRAWLDPQKLAAHGITATDVANAVRTQNVEAPVGGIGGPPTRPGQSFALTLDTLGRLTSTEQFGDIVVKVGQPPQAQTTSALLAPVAQAGVAAANPLDLGTMNGGTTTYPTVPASGSAALGLPPLGGGAATDATSTIGSGTTPAGASIIGSGTTSTTPGSILIPGSMTPSNTLPIAPAPTTNATGTSSGGARTGGGATTSGGSLVPGGGMTGDSVTGISAGGASMGSDTSAGGTVGAAGLAGGAMSGGIPSQSTPLVRLRDVARVELGAQNYNLGCTFDGKPSVGLAIFQLPGTNALDVADRVKQKLEELKSRFPDGVDYQVAYDTTPYIRESVMDVVRTLIEAVVLVGIVVLLFLQNWRAALIPLIAVPVAIIGTLAVMAALGFSLNNISLFGLVLAIGIVVDDAIVVVENVERWLEHGLAPRQAARKAMDEVTGPVIAVALVLCAVFVPCAFISGITGQFFRQFAVTISVSTVFSAINSLTLSPALAAILLRPRRAGSVSDRSRRDPLTWLLDVSLGWLFWLFNAMINLSTAVYARLVGWLLRLSVVVLLVYAGLMLLTYHVFTVAPRGFVPEQDQGRLILNVELPASASLERTQATLAQIEQIAHQTPGVAHTVAIAGYSFVQQADSSTFGSVFVVLEPFDKRPGPELQANAIMAHLRREFRRQIKDGQVVVFGAPAIPGLSVASGFRLMVEDRGGLGLSSLQRQTDALITKMRNDPVLVGPSTQFRTNTPQLFMDVDRTKVTALGVSIGDVNQTLDIFLGSLYVNSFNEFGRYWQVTLQAEGQYRTRVSDIDLLQVRNRWGQMVPLGTLANVREVNGPVLVTRYNLYPAAAITGTVRPGVSSGEAISEAEDLSSQTLPRSMGTEWTELMFMQVRAGNTAFYVFALSVVFVFLALAALYESWSLPLAVILVVPLCLLCSIGGVLFAHKEVDIFVQIGLVVLVGLACKNAILIVEFAQHLHRQGQSRYQATVEASRLRLRPILMTSMAFILGVVPLVIATGAGAEMRRSLGTAVFSGMVGVTLFGIFLTPVFFFVVAWLGERRLFTSAVTGWVGSPLLGGLLGLAVGFLLARLDIGRLPWNALVGVSAGAVLALLLPILWRRIRPRDGGHQR
jgi:multidrug efflux pump